jgi:hypothetical protein
MKRHLAYLLASVGLMLVTAIAADSSVDLGYTHVDNRQVSSGAQELEPFDEPEDRHLPSA